MKVYAIILLKGGEINGYYKQRKYLESVVGI